MIALRDGVPLRDALERLGIDTAPLDLPTPPQAVPFSRVPPGGAFAWQDEVWTRATLDQALTATPQRRDHPRVVAAYLAATQRGHAATAFRWTQDPPSCLTDRVEPDDLVTPAASPVPLPSDERQPAGARPSDAWTPVADRTPDPGRTVTIDGPRGPVAARLLLDDDAPGGVAWLTDVGERLDPDDVSRWRA